MPADRALWGRMIGVTVWLIYLGGPLGALLKGNLSGWDLIGIVALGVFVATYLWGLATLRWAHPDSRRAWPFLLTMLICVAVTVPALRGTCTTSSAIR